MTEGRAFLRKHAAAARLRWEKKKCASWQEVCEKEETRCAKLQSAEAYDHSLSIFMIFPMQVLSLFIVLSNTQQLVHIGVQQ